jgi:hypothetical protein
MRNMRLVERIQNCVEHAEDLEEVKQGLLWALSVHAKSEEIGYVAGMITSEGAQYEEKNRALLLHYAEQVSAQHNFGIFCAVHVFTPELRQQIRDELVPYEEWITFWRDILESGHVRHVFMAPRWQLSKGATDEHTRAIERKLRITYIEEVKVEPLSFGVPVRTERGTIDVLRALRP